MPGPSRINVLGLFCAGVSNAALLGGILFGLLESQQRHVGVRSSARALVIELVPLTGRGEGHAQPAASVAPAQPTPESRQPPRLQVARAMPVTLVHAPAPPAANAGVVTGGTVSSAESSTRESAFSEYQRRLYDAIARNSRYPPEARRTHLAGVTTIAFTIDRVGGLVQSWIQKSSGSDLLDNAALEALDRARPLPPLPAGLPTRIDFVIELDLSVLQQAALQTVG